MINETIERLRKEVERSDGDLWTFDVEDVSKVLAEIEHIEKESENIVEGLTDIIDEQRQEIDQLRASVEMAKRIVGNLTRENAVLKGEKPITVRLNGGERG